MIAASLRVRLIILVPFPFDDLSTQKARPAIYLTEHPVFRTYLVELALRSVFPFVEVVVRQLVVEPGWPHQAAGNRRGRR